MLKIRLARVGKKNYATFRVIVSDHTKSPKAEALEILGSFDPNVEPSALKLNEERVKYWLSKGVGYSDTIGDMLAKKGWIKKERIEYTTKHPKKKKSQIEKDKAAAAEKAKAAKAAPKAEVKATEKPAEPKKEEKKEAPAPSPEVSRRSEGPKAEAKKEVPKAEAKPAEKPVAKKEEKKEAPKPEDKKPEAKK